MMQVKGTRMNEGRRRGEATHGQGSGEKVTLGLTVHRPPSPGTMFPGSLASALSLQGPPEHRGGC